MSEPTLRQKLDQLEAQLSPERRRQLDEIKRQMQHAARELNEASDQFFQGGGLAAVLGQNVFPDEVKPDGEEWPGGA